MGFRYCNDHKFTGNLIKSKPLSPLLTSGWGFDPGMLLQEVGPLKAFRVSSTFALILQPY